MKTFDSFFQETIRANLLRYVAGRAIWCRHCNSILDWRRVWSAGGLTVCLVCSDKLNLRAAVRRAKRNPDDDEIVTESRPFSVPRFEIGARGGFRIRLANRTWLPVRGIRLHLPLPGSWFAYRKDGTWTVTNIETGSAAGRGSRLRGAIFDTVLGFNEVARKRITMKSTNPEWIPVKWRKKAV